MTQSPLPRILIIGDQGQVAWELKRTLATLGEVSVVGRNTDPLRLDLSQPAEIPKLVKSLAPDWIINAAAYTAVDKAEQETELAMRINGTAPEVLAKAAAECGALLVHYSTDYVFDGTAESPYREDAAPNPKSVYGQTKLAGEQAIQSSGANHLIFRTSWVYGSRGGNFLRTIRRLARERDRLHIVADQRGAPTWARHIAEATAQVLVQLGRDENLWRDKSGVYHLTSGGDTTWYDFACEIVEHQRQYEPVMAQEVLPIATEDYPLPAPRPRYSVLNNEKLKTTFNVVLPDWQSALEQVLQEVVLEKI